MNFHLGVWSPQECIDFLVDRVGHERDNATAEVRRSFQQAAPLYQAAYLLGGLQIRSLRKELVGPGPDVGETVPRRNHAAGQHADRVAAARNHEDATQARHLRRLEVLRRSSGEIASWATM